MILLHTELFSCKYKNIALYVHLIELKDVCRLRVHFREYFQTILADSGIRFNPIPLKYGIFVIKTKKQATIISQ